jgi:hypothetical protein
MTGSFVRRLGVCAALVVMGLPAVLVLADPARKTERPALDTVKAEYFKGKVVPLADLLQKAGAKLDDDAAPSWLALAGDDGKFYPLIKDDGSRMFFKDARLRNRPMRLTAKLVPGSHLLQVVEVHSYLKGELHSVYYWCDICNIKRYEKKNCDCCGAPMELREVPVKK